MKRSKAFLFWSSADPPPRAPESPAVGQYCTIHYWCGRRTAEFGGLGWYHMASSGSLAERLEELVTRDEGGRGIGPLAHYCRGNLRSAALELVKIGRGKGHVLILTGFPCNMFVLSETAEKKKTQSDSYGPVSVQETGSPPGSPIDSRPCSPQETDGPSGALAVARALVAVGCRVTVLTDECNLSVVQACATAAAETCELMRHVGIRGYPPHSTWDEGKWAAELSVMAEDAHGLVSLERAGPCADGRYLTMSMKDMSHLVAPLDRLLPLLNAAGMVTVGIGDGGNEVGMGHPNHLNLVARHVTNGDTIGCVVPARWLIPCSVSNWGGYALAAAVAMATAAMGDQLYPGSVANASTVLPSPAEEAAIVDAGISVGMRDGVTGLQQRTVDGMPWAATEEVLRQAHQLVALAVSESTAAKAAVEVAPAVLPRDVPGA